MIILLGGRSRDADEVDDEELPGEFIIGQGLVVDEDLPDTLLVGLGWLWLVRPRTEEAGEIDPGPPGITVVFGIQGLPPPPWIWLLDPLPPAEPQRFVRWLRWLKWLAAAAAAAEEGDEDDDEAVCINDCCWRW